MKALYFGFILVVIALVLMLTGMPTTFLKYLTGAVLIAGIISIGLGIAVLFLDGGGDRNGR